MSLCVSVLHFIVTAAQLPMVLMFLCMCLHMRLKRMLMWVGVRKSHLFVDFVVAAFII